LTPKQEVTLSWATFTDAADQAGISRRYGGIHFELADLVGRATGRQVADQAWKKALSFIKGKSESNEESDKDEDWVSRELEDSCNRARQNSGRFLIRLSWNRICFDKLVDPDAIRIAHLATISRLHLNSPLTAGPAGRV
jgi:hypothetical protein